MSPILINRSSLNQIYSHLLVCSTSFIPNLCSYIDIDEYSKKIFEKSLRFELIIDDVLIGLLAVYHNSKEESFFISNLSVVDSYKGKGLGQKLLLSCKNECKKLNYELIKLEVYKKNYKAVGFYKKNGFFVCEEKKDILIMEWKNMNRDYNKELQDTFEHKYAYNFDFNVIHHYMIESFRPYFKDGSCLELGSFQGAFTRRLIPFFEDLTCVEASEDAIESAKNFLIDSKENIHFLNSTFETLQLTRNYENIILTHVLEHIDDPVQLLKRINDEWLSKSGRLFLVCPNANAASRQIAVKMGLITHNAAVTPAELEHGHRITYSLDTLERDIRKSGLKVKHSSGIFFKALANFQWDKLLNTDIISKDYLDGCFELGKKYPDLCSSLLFICEKG